MSNPKPEISGEQLFDLCREILQTHSFNQAAEYIFSNYTPVYFRIKNTKCVYTKRGLENQFTSIRKGLNYQQHLERTNKRVAKAVDTAIKNKDEQSNSLNNNKKSGLELRGENIVINWSNKTIVTDLGEFGNFVCSFDMHKAVQRSYVHSGEGETAAIVAMKFDFPHAKAVHLYARIHGFTKSSLPQTDIEFEQGLTVEDAVKENIQTLKRQTYKKTELEKWRFTQECADKWLNFHHNVLKPLENHIEQYLPTFSPFKVNINRLNIKDNFVAVSGVSDIHYLKLCYDPYGNVIFDRLVALERVKDHVSILINKILTLGKPEKIIVPVANDNIHVDGFNHSTTFGTSQAGHMDGIWKIELGNYLDMTMSMIETYAQIAPVEVVVLFGNHDKQTSNLLQVFLERLYRNRKDINVHVRFLARTYLQFGKSGFIFTHSDEMTVKKLQERAHQLIIGEARQQGLNMQDIQQYFLFAGDQHADAYKDLNGFVKYYVMPSLTPCDEWHWNSGYSGKSEESAAYCVSNEGKMEAIYYTQ